MTPTREPIYGGLKLSDLRLIWSRAGHDSPGPVVDRLAEELHRTPGSIGNTLRTLRKIFRGEVPLATDQSTLWRATVEERHFIFTGSWPPAKVPQAALFADPNEAEASNNLALLRVLSDIRGALLDIRDALRAPTAPPLDPEAEAAE